MSTYTAKPGEIVADWHVVDASGQILGRLASKIAMIIQGKNKPTYTPHVLTGDCVIVLNAEKIRVTGKKADGRNETGALLAALHDMKTRLAAIVGGLVIGVVESLAGFYAPEGWKDIAPYVAVLIMLWVKPNGIFGDTLRKKV